MSVSCEECWQNVEVSRRVVGAEILPHPSLDGLVKSFHHDRFSFVVRAVHVNVVLFQIFLERLVVKFQTLVDPEPAWLPSATLDNVIKSLCDIFPCFGPGLHDPGILAEDVDDGKQVFDTVVSLGQSTHVH